MSPASVQLVTVVVAMRVPLRKTRYPATPTLSADADQESDTVDVVVPVTARFVGTEGGVVSGTTVTVDCAVDDPAGLSAVRT